MESAINKESHGGLAEQSISILCLEDNLLDRELTAAMVANAGIACAFTYAKTRAEVEAALGQKFDLIISDFSLPSYDGMSALAAARKAQPETPFIFLSGTIGEFRAVESLKNGATDYILKDRRERLVPAIERAIKEKREQSERRQLEEKLRQAQKMEAIGQLAGGVAHDFNNLLAVIQGNAELASMTVDKGDMRSHEFLTQIIEASRRAANLTRQLLAFSRQQHVRLETANLRDLIANLMKMLNRIIGEDIRLECQCEGRPCVRADVGMIEQVVLNLVVNSRDAMPSGGHLQISTRTVRVDEAFVAAHPEARTGEFVCLRVADTGAGIAPANLAKIFEPFFTTKEVGKGTGLGLATVYGIVNQHQGWVGVTSEIGKGTVFEIFLPALPVPEAPAQSPPSVSPIRGGGETILLVEDDDAVRLVTRQVLEGFGYRIVEAASGHKALDMWPKLEAPIHLLVTDMVMPDGVSGRQLVDQLRQSAPKLTAIFLSGYSFSAIGDDSDFLRRPNNHFIQKPYDTRTLADVIRKCLDAPHSRS